MNVSEGGVIGEGEFSTSVSHLPLVSIDLLVRNPEGPFSSVSARIGLLWDIGLYRVAE